MKENYYNKRCLLLFLQSTEMIIIFQKMNKIKKKKIPMSLTIKFMRWILGEHSTKNIKLYLLFAN